MYTPTFEPGRELQGNDGIWYRILEDLNDYSVRVWDFDSSRELIVEKKLFATY